MRKNVNDVTIIRIDMIKVRGRFKQFKPSQDKIEAKINTFIDNGKFDKPIIIDNNRILKDGYISLIVAKMIGLKEVSAIYV